jgi:hypothetical protein
MVVRNKRIYQDAVLECLVTAFLAQQRQDGDKAIH